MKKFKNKAFCHVITAEILEEIFESLRGAFWLCLWCDLFLMSSTVFVHTGKIRPSAHWLWGSFVKIKCHPLSNPPRTGASLLIDWSLCFCILYCFALLTLMSLQVYLLLWRAALRGHQNEQQSTLPPSGPHSYHPQLPGRWRWVNIFMTSFPDFIHA